MSFGCSGLGLGLRMFRIMVPVEVREIEVATVVETEEYQGCSDG